MVQNTLITLIRHGETEWNLSGRWQGHADSPPSSRGIKQAKALGIRMKSEQLDYFYSSDLGRAMHTAQLIGEPSGLVAEPFSKLRERDLGLLEGLNTDEMLEQYPEIYNSFRNDGPDFLVPQGESFRQFYERCANGVLEIAKKHEGSRIGIVTHGGVLGVIFRYVLNLSLEAERNFVILNCSLNRIERKQNGWNLISWGDVAHLQNMETLDDA